MAVAERFAWSVGNGSGPNGSFTLNHFDADAAARQTEKITSVTYPVSQIRDIKNLVHRAVAMELTNEAGAGVGIVRVVIA